MYKSEYIITEIIKYLDLYTGNIKNDNYFNFLRINGIKFHIVLCNVNSLFWNLLVKICYSTSRLNYGFALIFLNMVLESSNIENALFIYYFDWINHNNLVFFTYK